MHCMATNVSPCHWLSNRVIYLLQILDISLAVIYFNAPQVYIVQSVSTNSKLVPWCSMMFSGAVALLFQSAERVLIDVKSIHVATNEMEEILQLLTERDIEHTNNPTTHPHPTLLSNAYPYSPFPRHSGLTPSIPLCLSLHFFQSISSCVHFHKVLLHSDRLFYIF